MTHAHLVVAAAEEMIGAGIEFDGAFVYDDVGYRNTSLFSPAMFTRYEYPAHKLVYDWAYPVEVIFLLSPPACHTLLIAAAPSPA